MLQNEFLANNFKGSWKFAINRTWLVAVMIQRPVVYCLDNWIYAGILGLYAPATAAAADCDFFELADVTLCG